MAMLALIVAAGVALLPLASTARAAGPTMKAAVMLAGHVRLSTWAAITVDLANDGPALVGELRLTGGNQGRTRYSVPVDLPTGSSKRLSMYAQPSPFRSTFDLTLVTNDGTQIATASLKVVNHDLLSPLIGVIAERPQGLVPGIQAAANADGQAAPPTVATLTPDDLPDRVEGWGPLDRLVWQDVSTDRLSTGQIAALRAWVAGGGRLVLLGGTSGSGVFGALPDDLLPYRPTTTVDVAPAEATGLLGELPAGAAPLPASAGILSRGRALARAGDLTAAAIMAYGRGSVTLIGFDPATAWLANSSAGSALWRIAVPSGGSGIQTNPANLTDDSQLLQALYALPTLDLPPIDLLVGLLVVYTLLIGPLNYLVLKRIDRREWAWVTMPALVLVFSVGSYGLGLTLHGADTIVNELSIVSGSAGTDAGRAQVYVGLFSPSRRSFDVELAGPALVTSPISEYQVTTISQAGLDVIQGEKARVRGLEVGVSDLRTFRAETAATAPLIEADLRLEGAVIKGTLTNRSGRTLENVGVAFGSRLVRLDDLADGASAEVRLDLDTLDSGVMLSERLFGSYQIDPPRSAYTRRVMLDQLTQSSSKLPTTGPAAGRPMLIAFDSRPVVGVGLGAERPQQVADTLYLLDLPMRAAGTVVLTSALFSHQIIDSDAAWAGEDGYAFSLGEGSMTVAFQAIPLDGSFHASKLVVALLGGGDLVMPLPAPDPLPPAHPGDSAGAGAGAATGDSSGGGNADQGDDAAIKPGFEQGLPTFELFDRADGVWVPFEPLAMSASAVIADPERYVDASATLLVRFHFDDPLDEGQQAYFSFGVRIEGAVE
jgi:hypothetical protein